MNDLYVNDLRLPDHLVRMLDSDRWKPPTHVEVLARLGIEDAADLTFLSLAEMERNTNELKRLVESKQGELFGLVSGFDDPIREGHLDVTRAVMIATTFGQEALCLDYSTGDVPRVVATRYSPEGVTWVEVAQSFDDLLELLNTR